MKDRKRDTAAGTRGVMGVLGRYDSSLDTPSLTVYDIRRRSMALNKSGMIS